MAANTHPAHIGSMLCIIIQGKLGRAALITYPVHTAKTKQVVNLTLSDSSTELSSHFCVWPLLRLYRTRETLPMCMAHLA